MLEQPNRNKQQKAPVRVRPPDNEAVPQPGSSVTLSTSNLPELPRWLSVDQVRKLQRMRRETVIAAMQSGELPFERRGRICYIRLSDVVAWEERRLKPACTPARGLIHPDLMDLA
jgi:hypothetical protein